MAKYPVVVYGASGYTGMLTMDWLIDQNIPFTAVARDAKRVKKMMAERVVRLESATYEIIETQHDVESLTKAFTGAKVVCNTVGPFAKFGLTAVEAALKAGCHHIDTTGEQEYIRNVRDQFGELYAQAGLVVSPSIAYMYSYSEIAAELALEHPGIDALQTSALCRGPRGVGAGVTVGSTASIFEMFRARQCYLWDNELVEHPKGTSFNINSPDFMEPVFALPWGGTSLPIYFDNDPRVRSCVSCVGFYDNDAMKMVHAVGQKWEEEYKDLPAEAQDEVLRQLTESTTPAMPPRERTTLVRTVDTAIGRGQLSAVRATVYGTTAYIATGALQTAAAIKLLDNDTSRVGFTSGSRAFGHRYLLGFLEERGLARASVTEL
ncbi:MAG: saccharopine dehydrogenase NADP-binding domain-containing protein [Pseudomonadales bacterium]|nr:saccharopine dehydrogenase NADP-binding domain-containing protein [Pseudomonadales bacterium]MCP5166853.1 saccharopine dehydrogenase NADP-binding domain-containing protein [Pseudomonadales bacterium]MCP5186808.1 saccharopine dehydrogenase NADP-binding domain-containing protein [Pseudomonadales bacterium]